jgi:hypothetical protein
MNFLAPLGLFALAGVPLVLALHYFRRRLPERRAAGLFLFGPETPPADAGRTRTTLVRSPSLWLELAAALLLGTLCGVPSCGDAAGREHLVVVLDDSASMLAGRDGDTGAARARRAIEKLAADAGRDATITVVLTGDRPELLFGPRAAVALLPAAWASYRPLRPRHDPARAWSLALELADARDRIHFVTDEPPAAPPPRVAVVGVGSAAANDAVVSARRLRKSAAEESVLVDLAAYGGAPRRVRVRLLSGATAATATVLGETEVDLVPGKIGRVSFTAPRSAELWRVALQGDVFSLDDEAALFPEPRRPVKIADLLPRATSDFLRLTRALNAFDDVVVVNNPLDADLVFAAAPSKLERGLVECVVAAEGEDRDDWIGPYLFDRRHVLTAGLSLQGVVWSAAPASPSGRPLVLAGERALLTEEEAPGGLRLRLNLDPSRSNLPNAPDWPVLLANLIERVRRGLPGPVAVNVRTGEEIVYRLRQGAPDGARYVLRDPDGAAHVGRGRAEVAFLAAIPGESILLRDDVEVARFAARFADGRESDLTALATRTLPAAEAPRADDDLPGRDGRGRRERRLLALTAFLCLAADWTLLRRGATT